MDIKKPCFRQLHFGRKAPKHTLEHIFWQSNLEPPRFCRYTFDLLAVSGIWPAFRRQCSHMNSFTEAAEKSMRFVRRTPWQRRPYMRWINTCFCYIPLWCFEVPVSVCFVSHLGFGGNGLGGSEPWKSPERDTHCGRWARTIIQYLKFKLLLFPFPFNSGSPWTEQACLHSK